MADRSLPEADAAVAAVLMKNRGMTEDEAVDEVRRLKKPDFEETVANSPGCEHGCGREGLVEHADGRMLCLPCYSREVGIAASRNAWCDTCYPRGEFPTLGIVGPLAEMPEGDIYDFGDHPEHPDNA